MNRRQFLTGASAAVVAAVTPPVPLPGLSWEEAPLSTIYSDIKAMIDALAQASQIPERYFVTTASHAQLNAYFENINIWNNQVLDDIVIHRLSPEGAQCHLERSSLSSS